MKNRDYWKNRFAQMEEEDYKKSQKFIKDMEEQFRIAQHNITIDIERWYRRLADNNDISLAAAKQLLKRDELEEFHWSVEQYIEKGEDNALNEYWMKQLENASAKVHISRLEAMKLQIQQHSELLYTKYHNGVTDHLNKSYADRFYRTAYEIQKGTGVGSNLAELDTRKIDKILTTPWATDGKNFSDRIWNNKDKMIKELHRELSQSIIRGEDPKKAIDSLSRTLNASKKNVGRLVMTEMAAVTSAAQKDCFKELDVEQFEIVATLDSITSKICQNMDGKHFKMSEWEVGVTAPPFHVWCRSVTVPYFEDNYGLVGERAARDEDGNTYYVPANMTYPEWKKSFVEGESKTKDTKDKADYLIRSNTPGQNINNERKVVNEAIAAVPKKVQDALNNGTVIDVGKNGASQYDYEHDILYIAKGATKEAVIHEIGHMVENKMMDSKKVEKIKVNFLKNVPTGNIIQEIFYDAAGNPVEIFLLKNHNFVSEYQGRLYVNDWSEIYDENWNVRSEILQEFISEPFREYIQNPERLKNEFSEFYELIREMVE